MTIKGLIPADPTLESIEELVACAQRRVTRAQERLTSAQQEYEDAIAAQTRAEDDRAAWIIANPDPQLEMF